MARFSNSIGPGSVFGRLRVVEESGRAPREAIWLCVCECGASKRVRAGNLRNGSTVSCGCYLKQRIVEAHTTHGRSGSGGAYKAWKGMRTRCLCPTNSSFVDYGGRGIGICARWNDFAAFLEDMGERPSAKHSIDRIDVNGDYGPGNCRWATSSVQSNNKRNTVMLTAQGRTRPLSEWSADTGVDRVLMWIRVFRLRWSHEKAIFTPVKTSARPYRHGGKDTL